MGEPVLAVPDPPLERQFGLLSAVALNVTMLVGSGVFLTIPLMLGKLPGGYALLGWLAAGVLMLADGLIWAEFGAALPGSGGSYRYLLESYGPDRWGRLMAFLFIWQFLLSGPLEIATGFIAIAQVSVGLDPAFAAWSKAHTQRLVLGAWGGKDLAVTVGPAQLASVLLGVALLGLLYRRVTTLGKWAVTFWLGVLGAIIWIVVEGGLRFDPAVAFAPPPAGRPVAWFDGLGGAMLLAMFAYIGYYQVCYLGDEVRDPARTIPRSVVATGLLVLVLFAGLHLAMLGTVPWQEAVGMDNLPAEFMRRLHGHWAARLVTACLIWSSVGSCFAALLGYSRVPYGAARYGHFFAAFGRVHPTRHVPHVSLLLVAGLTFAWSFFDLGDVIEALLTTRILGQFLAQGFGLVLFRRQAGRRLPFRMWLYPLPCGLALVGWGYVFVTSRGPVIAFSLATLGLGVIAFLAWAGWTGGWPFGRPGPDPAAGRDSSDSVGDVEGEAPAGPINPARQEPAPPLLTQAPKGGQHETGP